MATAFAYVPSTFDGRTVEAREPQPIEIVPDPATDPWAALRELDRLPELEAIEVLATQAS